MKEWLRSFFRKHPTIHPRRQIRMGVFRRLTFFLRKNPPFMIIGAGKAGTTSLERYLIQHPRIDPVIVKEIHFFDFRYKFGKGWYKAHFPSVFSKNISGDFTPSYLDHPEALHRIRKEYPWMKFIVILRDPIERSYSQYQHTKRNGDETLTFEEAIKAESKRLEGEINKTKSDPNYVPINYNRYSYLERSKYHSQLKHWFEHFDRSQFLILQYEKVFEDLNKTMREIFKFLGLKPFEKIKFEKYNVGEDYEKINENTRNELKEFFKPFNKKLEELVGIKYN